MLGHACGKDGTFEITLFHPLWHKYFYGSAIETCPITQQIKLISYELYRIYLFLRGITCLGITISASFTFKNISPRLKINSS